jgi:hypothetical protein
MDKRKHTAGRRLKTSDKNLRALYAEMRKQFTAEDLQKYTELEEGIPAEKVLAQMERIHRKYSRKRP